MSLASVLSCFRYLNMCTQIQNPAVKWQNINTHVSNTLLGNKARWFCSAEMPVVEEKGKKVKITFVLKTDEKVDVEGLVGQNVMEVALKNDIFLDGTCGGKLTCSACQVYVDEKIQERLPQATEKEIDLLDFAFFPRENSRLGCRCLLSNEIEGAVFTSPIATKDT